MSAQIVVERRKNASVERPGSVVILMKNVGVDDV